MIVRLLTAALAVLAVVGPVSAQRAQIMGPIGPDGTEVVCDLPEPEHIKNVGGRDGAGLCVFSSIEMAGRWQNVEELRGFQQKMRQELGGGWPEKVNAMMAKYAPGVKFVQYSGSSPAILDLAMKTGRMVSVTYGYSERYGTRVAHMVNLVHLDDKWAVVLDNNFPGANSLEWMPRAEFLRRWQMMGGGWAVALLNPGPPPIPINASAPRAFMARQWGTGDCGPVGPLAPPVVVQQPPPADLGRGYEWKRNPSESGRIYLYRDGKQIGGWDFAAGQWRDFDSIAGKWSEVKDPPWKAKSEKAAAHLFGVVPQRIPVLESLWVNGVRQDPKSVETVFGDELADDSHKLRLTLVGDQAVCSRVLSDLKTHPGLLSLSGDFAVQAYRKGAWATDVFRLNPSDQFYLSIQGPMTKEGRGIEFHAQREYYGPEALAVAMAEAKRRVDPNYDPSRTPDLSKPKPEPKPDPEKPADNQLVMWLGAALLAIIFFGRRLNANHE